MSFITRKNKPAGQMTRCKRFAISASTKNPLHISSTSKPSFGLRNKITSAPGKRGWHFTPNPRRISNRVLGPSEPFLLRQRGLGGGEAGDWDPEGTAADVIKSE